MSKTEEKVTDIDKFVQEKILVTTVDGIKVEVPRLNWKKELILITLIQDVLKELGPTFSALDGNVMALITKILEVAPDKATRFVSTVVGKDDEWVLDNLDLPEVVAVILPLLKNRLDLIQAKLQPYLQGVPGLVNQAQ